MPPRYFSFWTEQGSTVSVSNISDITFNGSSENIRNRKVTTFTVYAPFFGQFRTVFYFHKYIREIDHFTLDLPERSHPLDQLKNFILWTIRRKTTIKESFNVRLKTDPLTYWKSSLKQEKHPYKWSTIEYNGINTGTSENIIWNKSSIQVRSTNKDWKTGYVRKTGPTKKFL